MSDEEFQKMLLKFGKSLDLKSIADKYNISVRTVRRYMKLKYSKQPCWEWVLMDVKIQLSELIVNASKEVKNR